MFRKLLIANRGEIACRVITTAKRLGIPTVAVYSESDDGAQHVHLADEAIRIGPPAAAQSYLVIDRIVEACRETGADAVHPGYGFLSENAEFVERLEEEKITFVGPGAEAIRAMGDKITSKKIAAEAGVNIIPGAGGALGSADEAVAEAAGIGYPVMLKASAGGGGKGMRIAYSDEGCREAFDRARGEAKTSFGDDRVFVEKFIENPRHIEIQVMADSYGNAIYLGERECSLQRRHQKVIEEAPSPFVNDAMRRAMGGQALALAAAVGYRSAGTVEFVAGSDGSFYFLEMNTRLQVEHPVTEMITGLDLVELMLRIAAGEELALKQEDVSLRGWALEARIYAEDPFRNFLPSSGRLVRYLPPAESQTVRIDSGVREGSEVSIHYDPMIAKLITHGETREEATRTMRKALDEFYIRGVEHNISFLSALLAHPRFVAGDLDTSMIGREYPDGFHPADVPHDDPEVIAAIAATLHYRYRERDRLISGQLEGYSGKLSGEWTVVMNSEFHPVTVTASDGGHRVACGERVFDIVTDWRFGQPLLRGTVNGESLCVQIERIGLWYRLTHMGSQTDTLVLSTRAAALYSFMPPKEAEDLSAYICSPMPGLLVSVEVAQGQKVKAGEKVAVVEAMKMENTLHAEQEGVVAAVLAQPGDSLTVDQPIIEFET